MPNFMWEIGGGEMQSPCVTGMQKINLSLNSPNKYFCRILPVEIEKWKKLLITFFLFTMTSQWEKRKDLIGYILHKMW